MTAKKTTNTGPDSEPDVIIVTGLVHKVLEAVDDFNDKWFDENRELVSRRISRGKLNDSRAVLSFDLLPLLNEACTRGVNIDEISKLYRSLMSAIVDKMHELDENQHDNAHLIGPVYRRKNDCDVCGLPVWCHVFENGDFYLSCACGETDIRKKAKFNRESFVFAEQGEI